MSINLKRKVYDACVLPIATYRLETTTLTQKSADRLKTSQRAMERWMLGIDLQDNIQNTKIRRRTKVKDIIELVAELGKARGKARLKQVDHTYCEMAIAINKTEHRNNPKKIA